MKRSLTLLSTVESFFNRHALAGRAGLVAVSGGPDSVALAHLLAYLQADGFFSRLVIAHLNHQLRGPDSDADEKFVFSLAEKLSLPCRRAQVNVAALAAAAKDNLENAARRARYDWLAQIAKEENASWVAVGHSADDQAETVLFRLLRGSGLNGLAGMRHRRPLTDGVALVRPLLEVRRSELVAYLQEHGHPYRMDASNLNLQFTRNRIRHALLPLLEKDYQLALVPVLARLSQQAREVQDLLDEQANELLARAELPSAGSVVILHVDKLASGPRHLQREVARLVWQRENWPQNAMTFEHWERFACLVKGEDAPSDFPDGVTVRRVGKVVQLERQHRRPGDGPGLEH